MATLVKAKLTPEPRGGLQAPDWADEWHMHGLFPAQSAQRAAAGTCEKQAVYPSVWGRIEEANFEHFNLKNVTFVFSQNSA